MAISRKQIILVFVSAFTLGFLFLCWLKYSVSPDYWPVGVDIYPRWVGTHAFWNQQSPYSPEVDLKTQELVYGRKANPEEDPFGFYYPAYAAIILAPLSFLPVEAAALLWSSFMWAIWVTLIVAATLSAPNRLSPMPWALILFSFFLYRTCLTSVLNGQYGIFVVGCWVLSWLMIRGERFYAAGFFLALSTIKPSLAMIPVIIIIFWSLFSGRAKVALGMFCTMGLLLLVSFSRIGWWIPNFIQTLGEYSHYLRAWSGRDLFTIPGIIWFLSAVILIVLGYHECRSRGNFPYPLFFGGVLLNLAITPHTQEYDLVVLILPLLFLTPILSRSKAGYLVLLFLIWAPWISWFLFFLADGYSEIWYRAIWQFYPFLLGSTLIITAIKEHRSTQLA